MNGAERLSRSPHAAQRALQAHPGSAHEKYPINLSNSCLLNALRESVLRLPADNCVGRKEGSNRSFDFLPPSQ